MKLHFDEALVRKLLDHSKTASSHRAPYNQGTAEPGLWLVGDQGVYLMSNGLPALLQEEGKSAFLVAYAEEVNPAKMDFDDWWTNKRASFGGDDGIVALNVKFINAALGGAKDGRIALNVTPRAISTGIPNKKR